MMNIFQAFSLLTRAWFKGVMGIIILQGRKRDLYIILLLRIGTHKYYTIIN
jgi:hypothetical protein